MTSKTTIPPQAYTRDTLTKAFDWLKTQPQAVKDRAVSADTLVHLFLHSKRFGSPTLALLDENQPNLEDLISVESFKKDLKNLAQGLKQFEDGPSTTDALQSSPAKNAEKGATMPYKQPPQTSFQAPSLQQSETSVRTSYHAQAQPPQAETYGASAPAAQGEAYSASAPAAQPESPAAPTMPYGWDEKTFWAVKSTRERFNLSSDQEALRMLVATGFDRLRNSF